MGSSSPSTRSPSPNGSSSTETIPSSPPLSALPFTPRSRETLSSIAWGAKGLIKYSSARVLSFLCFSKASAVAVEEVRMTGIDLSWSSFFSRVQSM